MMEERIIHVSRTELVLLIEEKYGVEFRSTRLSSTGFKGWCDK